MIYTKRLLELMIAAFFAAAVPVFIEHGLTKAGLAGAGMAGGMAVYGLLAKGLGDKDRPTIQ